MTNESRLYELWLTPECPVHSVVVCGVDIPKFVDVYEHRCPACSHTFEPAPDQMPLCPCCLAKDVKVLGKVSPAVLPQRRRKRALLSPEKVAQIHAKIDPERPVMMDHRQKRIVVDGPRMVRGPHGQEPLAPYVRIEEVPERPAAASDPDDAALRTILEKLTLLSEVAQMPTMIEVRAFGGITYSDTGPATPKQRELVCATMNALPVLLKTVRKYLATPKDDGVEINLALAEQEMRAAELAIARLREQVPPTPSWLKVGKVPEPKRPELWFGAGYDVLEGRHFGDWMVVNPGESARSKDWRWFGPVPIPNPGDWREVVKQQGPVYLFDDPNNPECAYVARLLEANRIKFSRLPARQLPAAILSVASEDLDTLTDIKAWISKVGIDGKDHWYRNGSACRANEDGECSWTECPQLRDNEPTTSRRHCPRDRAPL